MKKKLGACVIPFKCYAKNSFLEVHAWLHYSFTLLMELDICNDSYSIGGELSLFLSYKPFPG